MPDVQLPGFFKSPQSPSATAPQPKEHRILLILGVVVIIIAIALLTFLAVRLRVQQAQTETAPETADSTTQENQGEFVESRPEAIIGSPEPVPSFWPPSIPIQDYLVNDPQEFEDGKGGKLTLFSKKPLEEEKTAFSNLLKNNGWTLSPETTTDLNSVILIFENNDYNGGAELYKIQKDQYTTSIIIFVSKK